MKTIISFIENIRKIFYNEANNLNILGKLLYALIIAIITIIISKLVHKLFNKYLLKNSEKLDGKFIDPKKSLTITSVIDNTLKYIIYFIGLVLILEVFDIGKSISVGLAGIGG
ncbi:hypothetical protein [Miniphocaeibacter halophilus]|uniref:Uncharacterized protein n=1 Tax=Miniphocaeibacter halophilus TaxID=2931922 RepID=A0AC61MSC0_9FIRM|nr:hypothetical protein [Miniphocaeibacter halophilus]QQK08436.1 hypothetical protein JFY71_02555 [Miniphocaeibacter halophilus]